MNERGSQGRTCRILVMGPLPPPLGGCSVLLQYLVRGLADHPDVDVIPLRTSGPSRNPLRRLGRGVRVLGRLLRRACKADVLTLHVTNTSLPVLGALVIAVGRLFRKPVVIRKFGGPSHRRAGPRHQGCGRVRLAVIRWALRRADLYLPETRSGLHAAVEDGLPARQYPNNRPLASGTPERALGGACRRFVFASHVQPTKGIRELIEAAEQLPADASVDVYGPLRGGMTEQDFAGLQRVRYRGALDAEAVIPALAQHDALVLPTHHTGEGHPGILLESFLAGIPVIATQWGDVPEVVNDTCGLLVEPRDAESLRAAMQQLYDDADLYRRLCEGVHERREAFSTERWARRFADWCRELVEHRRRSQ